MNRTIKIISTLLIAALLVVTLSQVCLAGDIYGTIINDIDVKGQGAADNMDGVKNVAGNVVKLIRNVAAIAAVVIISILGIKYMMGSTEERAEYKKTFIPLIVGIVVVVAAASIASLLFGLM